MSFFKTEVLFLEIFNAFKTWQVNRMKIRNVWWTQTQEVNGLSRLLLLEQLLVMEYFISCSHCRVWSPYWRRMDSSMLKNYFTPGNSGIHLFEIDAKFIETTSILINVIRLPWNQTTITGWIVLIIICLPLGMGFFFLNGAFLSLFISFFEYHKAFNAMFRNLIKQMDQKSKQKMPNFRNSKKILFKLQVYNIAGKR